MAISNYPVWPFEPNWSATVTESLEWLTDVLTSPTGSEQRRALRYFPRQGFEFTIAAQGKERTLIDNMLVTYGARRWYLPLWHDVNFTDVAVPVGGSVIPCSTAIDSELRPNSVACLLGDSVYLSELVEIDSVTSTGVTLVSPTTKAWPAGTRLHPARVGRLTDQPEFAKRSDTLMTSEIRFQIVEATPSSVTFGPTGLDGPYRNFNVVTMAPDERRALNYGHERMLEELDNQTSIPAWSDTAARTFTYQQYAWVLVGRDEHKQFRALLQHLRGRAIPVWMPTFMQDLELAQSIAVNDDAIMVEPCGFTLAGGPRPDRQDIMIETLNGERLYRRITESVFDGSGNEIIVLDAAIGEAIDMKNILRISFMTLMRLNQDSVQIEHQTDTHGVSSILVTFRSAPDTRVPAAGF